MELWTVIVRFFQGGGEFMLPIAVVLVFGLAIAIERYIYLTRTAMRNRTLWNEIVPLLSQGNFRQVVAITSKSESAIVGRGVRDETVEPGKKPVTATAAHSAAPRTNQPPRVIKPPNKSPRQKNLRCLFLATPIR